MICFVKGVTILLSLTVFLNMVAETMPATSDAVPLLGNARPTDRLLCTNYNTRDTRFYAKIQMHI